MKIKDIFPLKLANIKNMLSAEHYKVVIKKILEQEGSGLDVCMMCNEVQPTLEIINSTPGAIVWNLDTIAGDNNPCDTEPHDTEYFYNSVYDIIHFAYAPVPLNDHSFEEVEDLHTWCQDQLLQEIQGSYCLSG